MGISVTNNSSRVLTGLVAWHIDDLKVVKSWLPQQVICTPLHRLNIQMILTCQTSPFSWVRGARRQTIRNSYFRSTAENRACQSSSTFAQETIDIGLGFK